MKFFKLVINEFIKILKRKSTIIFSILAVLSIILTCFLLYRNPTITPNYSTNTDDINDIYNIVENLKIQVELKDGKEKALLEEKIKIYQYILDNGFDNIINAHYKKDFLNNTIFVELEKLIYLDKENNPLEYEKQLDKVHRIWDIFLSGTFEDYIAFNIEEIENSYKNKQISKEEYETKINTQNELLKYSIGKYSSDDYFAKNYLLTNIQKMENLINTRYNFNDNKYITDKQVEILKNQILVEQYRLENSKFPYYIPEFLEMNPDSHYMYKYNDIVVSISMFVLALLVIILASSSISDETSKGTIKFLLITPYKRWKILLAKIISIVIFLIIATLIISQISNIVGNIFLHNASAEYIYVSDGIVKTLDTNTYRTLQFLLKTPGILVYMLFGITLSTLTRNTAISNTITAALYVAIPFGIERIKTIGNFEFLKYLPSSNFNLIDKLLPLNNYFNVSGNPNPILQETTLQFSILVITVSIVLLCITAFDSFNKKDI